MLRITLALLFIFCFNVLIPAQKVFEYNSNCQQAYKNISLLKINNAIDLLEKEKQQNPNNLIPHYLENYIDVVKFFFDEDITQYDKIIDNINDRIDLIKDGKSNSPFYKFCLSSSYLHKSLIQMKYGDKTKGAFNARKAFIYIKENKKEHKTFLPNDFLFGSMQTVIGTLPKGYKWIASILGVSGSVTEGMTNLRNFNNSSDTWAKFFHNESEFVYCFLMFNIENKKDETLQHIFNKKLDLVNNHYFTLMASNLALNNKNTELAKNIVLNRNKSEEYFKTNVWDFQLGLCKLYKLELDESIAYFEKFINTFKGNFYRKDVYQKLSWAYFLKGDLETCKKYRKDILTKGSTNSEADIQALDEAKKGKFWNTTLLQTRLLNDGGYNTEALNILKNKTINSFNSAEEKLEYVYRLGRIYDDLKQYDIAINYYNQAIEMGIERTEYFASRAALQTAIIYEKKNDTLKSLEYYNKVLDMGSHDYKNSIDQRAKSGIARIKRN
jgi:tetratricopeptide (TPR) repeat protein